MGIWSTIIDKLVLITQKKDLYVNVSLMSVLALLAIICNDLLNYTIFERTDHTSQSFTESLLMIHVLTFYAALLGFVYNTKAGKKLSAAKLEWAAVVLNFLLTMTRILIEISFMTYREPAYKNFNE